MFSNYQVKLLQQRQPISQRSPKRQLYLAGVILPYFLCQHLGSPPLAHCWRPPSLHGTIKKSRRFTGSI